LGNLEAAALEARLCAVMEGADKSEWHELFQAFSDREAPIPAAFCLEQAFRLSPDEFSGGLGQHAQLIANRLATGRLAYGRLEEAKTPHLRAEVVKLMALKDPLPHQPLILALQDGHAPVAQAALVSIAARDGIEPILTQALRSQEVASQLWGPLAKRIAQSEVGLGELRKMIRDEELPEAVRLAVQESVGGALAQFEKEVRAASMEADDRGGETATSSVSQGKQASVSVPVSRSVAKEAPAAGARPAGDAKKTGRNAGKAPTDSAIRAGSSAVTPTKAKNVDDERTE